MTTSIEYRVQEPVSVEQAMDIFKRAGLNRPTDPNRVENMLKHANVIITAWHQGRLVGFLRAMTDFSFDCYLNDLAVDPECQRQGIGQTLLSKLYELLEPETLVFLIAAPDAVPFYSRLGFKPFKRLEDTWHLVIGRTQ